MPNASPCAPPGSASPDAPGRASPSRATADVRVLRTRHGAVTLRRDQVVKDTRNDDIRLLSLDPIVGLRLSQNTIHRYGDDGLELGLMRGPRLDWDALTAPRAAVAGWVPLASLQEQERGAFAATVLRDKPSEGACVYVREVDDDTDADRVMDALEEIARQLMADTEKAAKVAAKRTQEVIERFRRGRRSGAASA